MPVTVENVSKVERRLTISVPANQFEEAYSKQIDQLAKKANIKGFRPGKAPVNVIQQRFGEEAKNEAMNAVIQKALYEAISEKNLRPVSQPRVEPKAVAANQPLEFIVSFEVLPDMEKIQFSMKDIQKLKVDITSADVGRVVDQLCKQYTKWNVVERAAKEKDRVVIDYYAIFDGKAEKENTVQNFPLELGSKVMLPGFEEGLIGAKAGEERTLNLTFAKDFPVADRAGKPVEFVVTVKQIFDAEAPVIDEEFIKRLGVKSGQLEELKTQIKQSLEQERDRLVKEKVKEQVFNQLLEQNPIEVPKALVAREASQIHDEIYPKHQHHDHHQHSHDELATFNDVAKKRVSLGLLIAEYAKQTDLKADKERVEARIKEIAAAYEHPQDVISWLSSDERRSGIEAQVMEDQVVDKLLEGVPPSEKTMSYAELKGIRV